MSDIHHLVYEGDIRHNTILHGPDAGQLAEPGRLLGVDGLGRPLAVVGVEYQEGEGRTRVELRLASREELARLVRP